MGLNDNEVIEMRKKYGSNILTKKKKNSFISLLLESLADPIIKILLIALAIRVVFILQNNDWYETIGIVIAILLASFISTISEYGSEKVFEKMQEEASKLKSKVYRNNKLELISVDEVVVGDIVALSTGDKVPADGVIIDGEVSVDESSINGESREIYKYKSDNLEVSGLYKGTTIYSKTCLMKVTSVGDNTFYGRLAQEIQGKTIESPLKKRLRSLAGTISKIGYVGAFLVSISYLFKVIVINNGFNIDLIINDLTNYNLMIGHLLYAATLTVTVIVVAVPEGLPMMITLVLSSNMKRMVKDNVLVRKLVGIETSGSINILLTDKTGTLTKGNLEVIDFISPSLNHYNSNSLKDKGICDIVKKSMLINNEAIYDKEIIGGNSTDKAFVNFFKENIEKNVISSVPFNSQNKYSMVTLDDGLGLIKGASEKILPYCVSYYTDSGEVKSIISKREITKLINSYTEQGVRVVCMATFRKNIKSLVLVGFVLIKDEIRDDVKESLELVKNANIQTIMITGDNLNTAISIGREINLVDKDSICLTSSELDMLTDEEIKEKLPKIRVIARALPQDKSRLVRICQEMDLVVGMTGDGVNDALALKCADVGFGMGSGTEVAKEASDIIILDNNFKSIATSILYGRTIFKSIRKFIIFQLTVNVCAVSLSVIGPLIGIDTPVTVIQMLWINMVMDTLAGLAFSYEPALKEYMEEKPKKKDEKIMNKYMKDQIIFMGIYSSLLCIIFLKLPFFNKFYRENSIYLMTAFFGLFIFMTIFNSFNARTSRLNLFANLINNKIFIFIIALILIIQIILIYYGGNLFRTVGLNLKELLLIILLSFTVIPVDIFRKMYLRSKNIYDDV